MSNFSKAIKTLEFDKILSMLVDCSPTDGSRALSVRLTPDSDAYMIRKRLSMTTDAKQMIAAKGFPSFGSVRDVTDAIERAEKGGTMSTKDLLDTAALMASSRHLYDYYFGDRNDINAYPSLNEHFARLMTDRMLETKITKTVIAEDMIADEASPELSDIRRKIRSENNKIKESLNKYVSGAYGKYLQENIVTQRNGRYVVPVKAEYKNEIKGLVHDTSASGATLFIEPLSVVDANNELRALESREKHEIERILSELSAMCAEQSSIIIGNYHALTELGFIFAKGELSYRLNATEPKIVDGSSRLTYKKARHPLIDKKKVVPISVELGYDYDTMVITGPNTGGKTVCMKTIGLLTLMAHAGLHIPCEDGAELSVFDSVLADIGDEQSIEQSLSTFSSHMVNIVDIMDSVTDRSLVLLDELGAGTDPTEGAALAMAIIGKVRAFGALCCATTHYAEIKAYALETEGVTNASCEFDIETLRPTYRLIIGTPGKSNAFAISRKLGISEDIISAAEAKISTDDKRFEKVIEELEARRIEAERERDAALRERAEFEKYRDEQEKTMKARLEASERQLEKNIEKAEQIITSAKITSEYVMDELEKIKRQKDKESFGAKLEAGRRDIRKTLRDASDNVNPVQDGGNEDYELPRPLKKGDTVQIVNLGQEGMLTADPDKNGNVTIQAGFMNIRSNIKNLRLIEEAVQVTTADKKRIAASKYQATLNKTFTSSLDLRGQYGDDAWFMTDKYLDEAIMANIKSVTLIHGKGTGALRDALKRHLKNDPRVKSFRAGIYGEGDGGVTVVELK
ncbi:MAG: endonuclease MutS2 [Ruminococcaceae bacterium]|nr:endonuclease MutS2 [Oscillospiraceae bacterium]